MRDRLFSNRDLTKLIFPLVIEQFLALFIGMADTIMVSTISESAVSAVSLVDGVNTLLVQLFSAMATGGAVVAAQYLGKGERNNACKAAKQLLYVSLGISLFIAAASIVFCPQILSFVFGALNERTMTYCRTYFYISALSYPALGVYNCGAALLRAMRNSKASMFASFVMNVVNVLGNAILIYVFKLEVMGAAIASLTSRCLSAVIMTRLLMHRDAPIHLIRPTKPEWDGDMIKRIFSLGIPNGLENSIFHVGRLLVSSIVSTFSVAAIAANAVCGNITSICNLPGSAIGLAMVTVIGQCVGAGDGAQARMYAKKLFILTEGLMIIMGTLMLCFSRQITGLFNLSPEGVDIAVQVISVSAFAQAIFWMSSFTIPNALRAAGDAKFTMLVSIACMWIFRIGASYLLVYAFNMGLLGVWCAMFIDWVVRGALFIKRYCGDKWLTKRVV